MIMMMMDHHHHLLFLFYFWTPISDDCVDLQVGPGTLVLFGLRLGKSFCKSLSTAVI